MQCVKDIEEIRRDRKEYRIQFRERRSSRYDAILFRLPNNINKVDSMVKGCLFPVIFSENN